MRPFLVEIYISFLYYEIMTNKYLILQLKLLYDSSGLFSSFLIVYCSLTAF